MQDPAREIADIVRLLTTTKSPDVQKATVEKYFKSDAGFKHPVCSVAREPESRKIVLGIYQWYKIISPTIVLDVQEVVYNPERNTIFLDITQKFHLRYSPLRPAPARLVTKLTLEEVSGSHYIALQEDYYHPEDFISLILPPAKPLVNLALMTASLVSNVNTAAAQMFGLWRPSSITSQHRT